MTIYGLKVWQIGLLEFEKPLQKVVKFDLLEIDLFLLQPALVHQLLLHELRKVPILLFIEFPNAYQRIIVPFAQITHQRIQI